MLTSAQYVSHETFTRKRGVKKVVCSRCSAPLEKHRVGKQSYCLTCHAEYMRLYRPKHSELKKEARMKANARATTRYYLKKGEIEVKTCEVCGAPAEKHHDDYNKPKVVRWMCRSHHLEWHRIENGKQIAVN